MAVFNFVGKHVLITGANRGIGLSIARAFLDAGARVTITGLEPDTTQRAINLSDIYRKPVSGVVCDVTDKSQVRTLADSTGRVDILINNAGLELVTPLGAQYDDTTERFLNILNINVAGMFRVIHSVAPNIPTGGRIVNTASIWGKTAVAEFSAYCASKHGVIGLTRSLALELAPRKISVNAVCPGWVKTEGSMRSVVHMSAASGKRENEIIEDALAAQALDGLMTPDDLTDIYLFLASEAARNITGQSYTIDRGETLQ